MNKLVSIVVPVYNVQEFLPECLESIINQTYKNLEIILVDDGSKDDSGKICDAYAEFDKRIRVIHKSNGGLGDARNAGIMAAKGEYLLFVDSDDWVHKDLVHRTYAVAEANNADIVVFHFARVEENKRPKNSDIQVKLPQNIVISSETYPGVVAATWTAWDKMYKRSFWNEHKLEFTRGRYFEDLGTVPKATVAAERVVHISDTLYFYRVRSGSIMNDKNLEKNFTDRIYIIESIIDFFKANKLYDKFEKELEYITLKNLYFYPAREIVYRDKDSEYLKKFREYAFSIFPKLMDNVYIKDMPLNDRLFLKLVSKNKYHTILTLSNAKSIIMSLVR